VSEPSSQSGRRAALIGPGRFVLVVGPSGAGKDTLIGLARKTLAEDRSVVFPCRVVTREPSVFEDNEQLGFEEFRQARARSAFAVHWEAHGHGYGLRREIDDELRAGRTVVANVSRRVIDAVCRSYARVTVVSITAPSEILAQRLAARARKGDGQIEHRLSRAVGAAAVRAVSIVNVGAADDHAHELVRIIKGA
jgi:ribose 1,5-bisphosphokinase